MVTVDKYGGCYLRNMEDMNAIAKYVAENHRYEDRRVIVVAAMYSIAERILAGVAEEGNQISQEELDKLFSAGEKQTASLMTAALNQRGVMAQTITDIKGYSLSPYEKSAGKREINLQPVIDVLEQGQIAVVAGFQGIGDFHHFETKGRYGAATTAVIIAAGLDGSCRLFGNTQAICNIEADFSGYESNPTSGTMEAKLKNKVKRLKRISYEEAMDMVLTGPSDLESRALEIGKELGVKLYVGPALTNDTSGGTYIMDKTLIVQEGVVKGISVTDDVVVYTLEDIPNDGQTIGTLFRLLGEIGVNVDLLSQQNFSGGINPVSFSCPMEKVSLIDRAFSKNAKIGKLKISKKEKLTMVSIVGVGLANYTGVAGRVFSALAKEGIPHYNVNSSKISISVAIDECNRSKAIVVLGDIFKL